MSFLDFLIILLTFLFDFFFGEIAEFIEVFLEKLHASCKEGILRIEGWVFDDFREEDIEDGTDLRSGSDAESLHEIRPFESEHFDRNRIFGNLFDDIFQVPELVGFGFRSS